MGDNEFTPKCPRRVTDRAAWLHLMRSQHGLIRPRQAAALGLSAKALERQVDAGRWRRVHYGVYACFTGPLDRPARLSAALLYAGQPAVLSHATAAAEWGMLRVAPAEPIHVTVPYECHATSLPGEVLVHRSRAYRFLVRVGEHHPRTSIADTILDTSTAQPDAEAAIRTFVDLCAKAYTKLGTVRRVMLARKPWRYRSALERAWDLVLGGAMSALEAEYVQCVETAHGLPAARRQVPVMVDGRRLYEDCVYDNHGLPCTVRLDGRTHAEPGVAFRDRRRDNAAELARRARLVYGWDEVSAEPCAVAAEVHTVLRRLGWLGPLRRCSRCSEVVNELTPDAG